MRLLDFNGDLQSANATARGIEFVYQSSARSLAVLDKIPRHIEIDGFPARPSVIGGRVLLLPREDNNTWSRLKTPATFQLLNLNPPSRKSER